MWEKLNNAEKKWFWALVTTFLLAKILLFFPVLTQVFFTQFLFAFSSQVLHFSLGWIPFSIGDVGYLIIGILFLRRLIKIFKKHSVKTLLLLKIITTIAPIYILFQWLWGFNYYKLPLHQQLNIQNEYTTEQLFQFTEKVLLKTNTLQETIAQNDTLIVHFPSDFNKLKNEVYTAFSSIEKNNVVQLIPKSKNLKKSIFSGPLTYMGFAGYINPFTNEAQMNTWIPPSKWHITSTHEIAHQLGYGKENEANFIAAYVCTQQKENRLMQYAGFSFALKYCLNELYLRDQDKFEYLYNCTNIGVLKNFKEQNEFWGSYDNVLEPLFKLIYKSYLEANNQPDGLETYSYVTALLINHGLGL